MSYINKQNIKALAKSCAKTYHDKDVQISADFINQIEQLVELCVKSNVLRQERLKGTLKRTSWASSKIRDGRSIFNA